MTSGDKNPHQINTNTQEQQKISEVWHLMQQTSILSKMPMKISWRLNNSTFVHLKVIHNKNYSHNIHLVIIEIQKVCKGIDIFHLSNYIGRYANRQQMQFKMKKNIISHSNSFNSLSLHMLPFLDGIYSNFKYARNVKVTNRIHFHPII